MLKIPYKLVFLPVWGSIIAVWFFDAWFLLIEKLGNLGAWVWFNCIKREKDE